MSNNQPTRREILRQIETGGLSAAEGRRLIEGLSRGGGHARPGTEAPVTLCFRGGWEKTAARP